MNIVTIKPAETNAELEQIHQIRKAVFVVEQNCPEEIEWEFEEESHHYIAFLDGAPAGTARWRATTSGIKLERFAVLKKFRNQKVGESLLKKILEDTINNEITIYLHAQITAKEFYLKYNFKPKGEHFWEAGIEHIKLFFNR